jgi:TonB family protein
MNRRWRSLVVAVVCLHVAITLDAATRSEKNTVSNQFLSCAIATPPPQYPYAARFYRIEGRGIFAVRVQISTGRVKEVKILTSTNSKLLDQSSVAALWHWRFRPGALPSIRHFAPRSKDPFADQDARFKVPIAFVMDYRQQRTGAYQVRQPL